MTPEITIMLKIHATREAPNTPVQSQYSGSSVAASLWAAMHTRIICIFETVERAVPCISHTYLQETNDCPVHSAPKLICGAHGYGCTLTRDLR